MKKELQRLIFEWENDIEKMRKSAMGMTVIESFPIMNQIKDLSKRVKQLKRVVDK